MKVNMAQAPGQGGLKVKTGGAFTDSLKEGDKVKAQVLSSATDAVVIKTDGGHIIRARLDAGVKLLPGDDIQLEVSEKDRGTVFLSIIGSDENRGGISGEIAGQTGVVRGFTDKSLAPYAEKLAELNMPVTEETARLMRELIAQNPGMTLDEAAFLASNKLTGDANIIKAAQAVLSGGEKTDDFIARILTLLNLPETGAGAGTGTGAVTGESGIRNPEFGIDGDTFRESVSYGAANPANLAGTPSGAAATAGGFAADSMLDWLAQFGDSEAGTARNPGLAMNMGQPDQNMGSTANPLIVNSESANGFLPDNSEFRILNSEFPAETAVRPIISQSDTIMQSQNVENVENNDEVKKSGFQKIEQTVIERQRQEIPNQKSQIPNLPSVSKAVTELLSEIPEFRATPAPALERFTKILLRAANDSPGNTGGTDKLAALLDKLFTRIERNDNDGGQRLRNAKEELYARLAFIEEEISRSAPPAKTEMLEQTQRLMDHVRMLNDVSQFAYMQLPVKLGEERKTAELYLFKRKGGKRADPENVNILLALDLENMGHWEALLNFRNKDVSIQMEVPGKKEKEYFSENTVMLHEMLAEAGFKLVNTDIKYSKKETTPLTALSSLSKYIDNRTGMIDFTI